MRPAVKSCLAALVVVCAAPIGAQTPIVQGGTVTRAYTTTAAVMTPAQQIAALQQEVTLLQAAVAALQAKTQLLTSDGTNLSIRAPGSVTIQAQQSAALSAGALTVSSSGTVQVQGAATLALQGAIVQINGGGKPAARLGDAVAGGSVVAGSPTVLIGP